MMLSYLKSHLLAAMDAYIQSRGNVLSSRTISEYKKIRKTYCKSLMPKKISEITQEDIQG